MAEAKKGFRLDTNTLASIIAAVGAVVVGAGLSFGWFTQADVDVITEAVCPECEVCPDPAPPVQPTTSDSISE